jgi:tRNA pseudouridine13 synthase
VDAREDNPERLPYVTEDLAGIGGHIKSEPRAFVVEEIPLYEPSGAGEHVYVTVRREGRTTRDLVLALARAFRVRETAIGCAGQKDKRARATQTFSIAVANVDADEVARRVAVEIGVEVLSARRHANKLRRGHSLGNRFDIRIEDAVDGALEHAGAVARALAVRGLPSFYGPQRFGADGRNADRGRALLDAPRRDWTSRFLVSAYQASLFNTWLAERMRRCEFDRIIDGDVAKRLDTGALFDVADEAAENRRMALREITYTGPIFGARMRRPIGRAAEIEDALLLSTGLGPADFARADIAGSRRAARLFIGDLSVSSEGSALRVRMSLPKGAYATVVLREIMKSEAPLAALDDEA